MPRFGVYPCAKQNTQFPLLWKEHEKLMNIAKNKYGKDEPTNSHCNDPDTNMMCDV